MSEYLGIKKSYINGKPIVQNNQNPQTSDSICSHALKAPPKRTIYYHCLVKNPPQRQAVLDISGHHGSRELLRPFFQDDQVRQHTHPMDLQHVPLWSALVDLRVPVLQGSHLSCLCAQRLGWTPESITERLGKELETGNMLRYVYTPEVASKEKCWAGLGYAFIPNSPRPSRIPPACLEPKVGEEMLTLFSQHQMSVVLHEPHPIVIRNRSK